MDHPLQCVLNRLLAIEWRLYHLARAQHAQGELLECIAIKLNEMSDGGVDPALAAALAESKSKHDVLKKALADAAEPTP